MAEQNEMLKIVTPMMEHVCDHLCRFPRESSDQEELDRICGGCEMGQHLCNILNQYDKINNFEKTQCSHLLKELAIVRAKQGGSDEIIITLPRKQETDRILDN